MAENTGIEWCDSTFNPWTGCTKVSPACDLCYAEKWSKRAGEKVGKWGPGMPRVRTTPANWRLPLRWQATPFWQCTCCGWRGVEADTTIRDDGFGAWVGCPMCHAGAFAPARRRVFCASLADVFDNEVDPQWRADLFGLILRTPNLDWLLLTKRIGNASRMLTDLAHGSDPDLTLLDMMPLPNVWLGATICNQEEADRDIPKLLAVPAAKRFVSMEPLLGPVELGLQCENWSDDIVMDPETGARDCCRACDYTGIGNDIDWVIVGGESGHGARPMHPDWARSLRDQCEAAGVPFLFKQWGEWEIASEANGHFDSDMARNAAIWLDVDGKTAKPSSTGMRNAYGMVKVGKKAAGRVLDGRTCDGVPS